MHFVHAYSLLLMVGLQWPASRGAFHDAPKEDRRNEDRANLHPGRVILYRAVTANNLPKHDQDRHPGKHRSSGPASAPNQPSFRQKPHDYDHKLPASKYANDYFQPPRPRPTPKHVQNRVGFAFPLSHNLREDNFYWAQRGVHRQQNLIDYNQNQGERPTYHHPRPAVITYDNGDLRAKHRPVLFQQNILPGSAVDGSNVIVASGPGGVEHIIHDLRIPQQHQGSQQKTIPVFFPHGEPKPAFGEHRFSGGFNQPETHAYKGVPVFVDGGTFAGKEYDPRFVTLYRQVLEENQEKALQRYQVKTRHFTPSPVFGWFSEPDPLYHSRSPQFITSTAVGSTVPSTQEPVRYFQPGESFPDSINSQLPPPTAHDNTNFQYQASTDQRQHSPSPTRETESTETAQEKTPVQVLTTEGPAEKTSSLENLPTLGTAASKDPKEPEATLASSNPTEESSQQLTSVPEETTLKSSTETILTSISKSVTAKRDPKTFQEFSNLSINKRVSEEESINSFNATIVQDEKETPTTEAPAESTTVAPAESVTEAPAERTTEPTEDTTIETSTTRVAEETMATTLQALTEAAGTERVTAAMESQTQPTTTTAELALTTMNFVVMSLVNQARAIASQNVTGVTAMEGDASSQSVSVS